MGSVRVVIHTAAEGTASILSDVSHEDRASTRVIILEARDVVYVAVDQDERSGFRLSPDCAHPTGELPPRLPAHHNGKTYMCPNPRVVIP